jgi:hypothetical protein
VNPASAVVRPGGSVSFVATGGVGSPIRYIIGQTPGDVGYGTTAPSSASEGDTITYTAPAVVAADLDVTISVTDGSDTVYFRVKVPAPAASPLSVVYNPAPSGKKIKIEPNGTIEVTASGGKPPYTFVVPEREGAIAPLAGEPGKALYTASSGNTKKVSETIVVSDSATPSSVDSVTVEIQKP